MNFTTRALWLAGSRRGYNADVSDDSSFSSGEDVEDDYDFNNSSSSSSDKSICGTSSSSDDTLSLPLQFYKDVKPRHRRRRRCQSKDNHDNNGPSRSKSSSSHHPTEEHPDIDLSLVSLLTSKEHDRKQMRKLQRSLQLHRSYSVSFHNISAAQVSIITGALGNTLIEDESSSSTSYSSSSEGSDDVKSYCNSIIKTEQEYKTALSSSKSNRPLAVIDYGSVQFGQLGSVLDSIYKIGVEKKNKVVGDDSCCSSSKRRRRRNDEILFLDDRRRSSSNEETASSTTANFDTTSQQRPPSAMMTVAGSRSSEVSAVIASLKNPTANTMKRKASHNLGEEDCTTDGVKKLKLATSKRIDPETSSRGNLLSLEDAVAFSPYARVLFTAEFPHTVVHVNAAYGTLVKKGLASPCALGRPMTTTANIIGNSSSTHQEMSNLKEETVSKIITNQLGISKESITYHLFPVISDDKSFCNFVRSYQKHDYSTHHPFLKNEFGKTEEHEDRYSAKHSHVSHYLLQIGPVAQFTSQLDRL